MPANQTKVKQKIAQWLKTKLNQDITEEYKDITNKTLIPRFIKEREDEMNKLIKYLQSTGHCQGFSLVRGAMISIGFGDWWDEVMHRIETTDVAKADFNKKITLKHSSKETTLEELFNRVLNYIVASQVSKDESETDFLEEDVSQLQYIEPNPNRFQILGQLPELKSTSGGKDNLQTIKERKIVGGNFSIDDATKLFNLTNTEGLICLIWDKNHALEFDIHAGKYRLCDPNYGDAIFSSTSEKTTFIENIQNSLGNEYMFIILSLNKKLPENLFSYYDELINNKPVELAKGFGLYLMFRSMTDKLDLLVKNICDSKIIEAPDIITEAMTKTIENTLVLSYIASERADLLSKLIAYAKQSSRFPEAISKALSFRAKKFSALAYFANHHKTELANLINEAEKSSNWPCDLLAALETKDEDGITGLRLMAEVKKVDMLCIINAAAKHELTKNYIARVLSCNINGMTPVFHFILCNHPNSFNSLLKLLESTKEGQDELAMALSSQSQNGWSGLQILMANHVPTGVADDTIKLAEKSKFFFSCFAKAIFSQTNVTTSFHLSCNNHFFTTLILKQGDKSPIVARAITCALLTKNQAGQRAIDILGVAKLDAESFLTEEHLRGACIEYEIVFDYIVANTKINAQRIITEGLLQTDENGDWMGLFAEKSTLQKALSYVQTATSWPGCAVKILNFKNKKGEPLYLELLMAKLKFKDETLSQLAENADKSKKADQTTKLVKMLLTLDTENPENLTPGKCPEELLELFLDRKVLQMFINEAPDYLTNLMTYLVLSQSDSEAMTIVELMFAIDENVLKKMPRLSTLLHSMSCFIDTSPDHLSLILFKYLSSRDSDNNLVVFDLLKDSQQWLLRTIDFIACHSLGLERLVNLFKLRNENQECLIKILMKNPETKKIVFNNFKQCLSKESNDVLNLYKAELKMSIYNSRSYFNFNSVSGISSIFMKSHEESFIDEAVKMIDDELTARNHAVANERTEEDCETGGSFFHRWFLYASS